MRKLICSEFYVLFKWKKALIPILAAALFAALACFLWFSNLFATDLLEENGYDGVLFAFVYLFTAIVVSLSIHANYGSGLLSKKLAAGYTRTQIYLASLCTALIIGVTVYLIFSVSLFIEAATYDNGFPESADYLAAQRQFLLQWSGYLAAGILSMAAFCALITFLGLTFRSELVSLIVTLTLILLAIIVVAYIFAGVLEHDFVNHPEIAYDEFGNEISWSKWVSFKKSPLAAILLGVMKLFPPILFITSCDPYGGVVTHILVALVLFLAATAGGLAVFGRKNLR